MRFKMDSLSKFLIDSFGSSKTAASKTQEVRVPELTVFEKWAYGGALAASSTDESWLQQFEGTELAPQAIALAEQELAMEQRQLQQRMQRNAERQNDNWEQNCIEQDGLRLQKQQLVLSLYKMKAMTPTPKPGDAVIGTPLPQPAAPEMGMGPEGGAPVEEPMPGKMAADKKKSKPKETGHPGGPLAELRHALTRRELGIKDAAYRDDAAMSSDAQTSWEGMGRGSRALHHGMHGAAKGGLLGTLGGIGLHAAGAHGVTPAATGLGALAGGALGALRGATSPRPTMGLRGLGLDNVHRSATDRVEKRKAKEESDAAKAEAKKEKGAGIVDQAASAGWRQRVAPVKDFARTVAAGMKTSSFDAEMLAILPKGA